MESFNRVLYFILGLVVVLVFFIIVFTGRLNLSKSFRPLSGGTTTPTPTPQTQAKKGFFSFLGGQPKATPTPTVMVARTPTQAPSMSGTVNTGSQTQGTSQGSIMTTKGGVTNVQTIPSTGSPVEILYLALPTLSAGLYLRKRS